MWDRHQMKLHEQADESNKFMNTGMGGGGGCGERDEEHRAEKMSGTKDRIVHAE